MDNPNFDSNEDKWVEDRIAKLSPPPGWKPDTERAFERVIRQQPAAATRSLQLLMAGATLAVIGLVLTMLPWHMLWTPEKNENTVAAQQPAVAPAQASPDPAKTETPAPAVTTPAPQPEPAKAPATPEQTPPQPAPRRKKMPRIIAEGPEAQQGTNALLAAAASAQGQGQQPAPPPGNVSDPRPVSAPQPEYTPEARDARIQGTVELRSTVREDGTVKVESVVRGLGYGLDEAAIAAVEKWKFIPAKKDGKPVSATIGLLVNFSLR